MQGKTKRSVPDTHTFNVRASVHASKVPRVMRTLLGYQVKAAAAEAVCIARTIIKISRKCIMQ